MRSRSPSQLRLPGTVVVGKKGFEDILGVVEEVEDEALSLTSPATIRRHSLNSQSS